MQRFSPHERQLFAQLGQGFEIGPFLCAEQTFVVAIHQRLEPSSQVRELIDGEGLM